MTPRLFGSVALLLAATYLTGCAVHHDATVTSVKKMLNDLSAEQREVDDAERRGDSSAQMQAGLKMLSTVVRGGAPKVTPIAHDDLKTLLPKAAAGLARNTSASSSGALNGIAASSAHATYGRSGGATIDVTIADLSNMGGLAAAANLATTMSIESDDDGGYEKNVEVSGHRVHEKWTTDGKRSDLTEIVGNRYFVSVVATGIAIDSAVAVVRSIDMVKFQSLGASVRH